MCEIAILEPEYDAERFADISFDLYERMRSSLGIAAVVNEAGSFSYDIFRDVSPVREDVEKYFRRTLALEPRFYIIHARLKTHGSVIDKHAHPLEVGCDKCDVDYVTHNGVVHQYWNDKREHKDNGHNYSTDVDSEVIAHEFGTVPDGFEHEALAKFQHQPAFVLMNSKRVYVVSVGSGYHLSDKPEMARSGRDFGPDVREENYAQVLVDAEVDND